MNLKREVKEVHGKVLVVEFSLDTECRISRLVISGDFFAFPPEALDMLEISSLGRYVGDLLDLFSRALDGVVLAGISRETVLKVIKELVIEGIKLCQQR